MCVLVFLSTTPVILLVSQGSHKLKDLHVHVHVGVGVGNMGAGAPYVF